MHSLRKIKVITLLLSYMCIYSINSTASENNIASKRIIIPLIYSHKYNTPAEIPLLTKPIEVSGETEVGIQLIPLAKEVQEKRYLVEYFIDGELVYSTHGENEQHPENPGFDFILDTTKYKNKTHKLIVNFWDNEGDSAIGIMKIIMNN